MSKREKAWVTYDNAGNITRVDIVTVWGDEGELPEMKLTVGTTGHSLQQMAYGDGPWPTPTEPGWYWVGAGYRSWWEPTSVRARRGKLYFDDGVGEMGVGETGYAWGPRIYPPGEAP